MNENILLRSHFTTDDKTLVYGTTLYSYDNTVLESFKVSLNNTLIFTTALMRRTVVQLAESVTDLLEFRDLMNNHICGFSYHILLWFRNDLTSYDKRFYFTDGYFTQRHQKKIHTYMKNEFSRYVIIGVDVLC